MLGTLFAAIASASVGIRIIKYRLRKRIRAEASTVLKEYLKSFVSLGRLPLIGLRVMHKGKLLFQYAAGTIDDKKTVKYDLDSSLLRFYSMTKPITSVAVLQLMEKGKLNLDDPIGDLIPEWDDAKIRVYKSGSIRDNDMVTEPAATRVTVRHLLSHTSGITYGFWGHTKYEIEPKCPVDEVLRTNNVCIPGAILKQTQADIISGGKPFCKNLREYVERFVSLPVHLVYHPGTAFIYGMNTDILGRLVEVVSGQSFSSYLQDHILTPLGMHETAFAVKQADLGRFANCFRYAPGDKYSLVTIQGCGVQEAWLEGSPRSKSPSGGGGLISTVRDYMKFAEALLGSGKSAQEYAGVRLLSRDTIALMREDNVEARGCKRGGLLSLVPGNGFGLGVTTLLKHDAPGNYPSEAATVGTGGWSGAAGTHWYTDHGRDLIVVLSTQILENEDVNMRPWVGQLIYSMIGAKHTIPGGALAQIDRAKGHV